MLIEAGGELCYNGRCGERAELPGPGVAGEPVYKKEPVLSPELKQIRADVCHRADCVRWELHGSRLVGLARQMTVTGRTIRDHLLHVIVEARPIIILAGPPQ